MKRRFGLRRFLSQALRLPLAGPLFKLYAPRRRWKQEDSEPRVLRVLIANLMPSLGDTICYMAAVEVLADAIPGVEITWLADSAMAGIVADHPDVYKVLTITTPHPLLKRLPTVKMYYRLYRIMRILRRLPLQHRFDVAIIPRGGVDPALSAHAVWMLNVSRSVGYSHLVEPDDVDHNFGDQLITDLVTKITVLHESSRAIYLLEKAGVVPDATLRWNVDMPIRGVRWIASGIDKKTILHKAAVPVNRSFIVLSPGSGLPRKTWPVHKFIELGARILDQTDSLIVLTGTPAEGGLGAEIAKALGSQVINTIGKLTLPELIALLSHARAFVGNDSGAGHVAGPLGVPVISLHVQPKNSDPYHIHAPEHYRPAGPNVTILQPDAFLAPCYGRCESTAAHCIDQIEVDQVWEVLKGILQHAPLPASLRVSES